MKKIKFTLFLILALVTGLSYASSLQIVCVAKTAKDQSSLAKLKLKPSLYASEIGVLFAESEKKCTSRPNNPETKICEISEHTLVVNGEIGTLVTSKGKVINLTCTIEEVVGTQGGVGGSN